MHKETDMSEGSGRRLNYLKGGKDLEITPEVNEVKEDESF